VMYVTTEHFKIRNKSNGNYLKEEEVRRIFPANAKTNCFIDFVRLRPKISENIPGEQIKLTSEFSVANAKINSMYNVVSKCTFMNTKDAKRIIEQWEIVEEQKRAEGVEKEDIEFKKRDFMILDAQRIFVENSFDFVIQSIGIYANEQLVIMACELLRNKAQEIVRLLESDAMPIYASETTIDNCYDVVLENEDYTIGKVLEYFMYDRYYMSEKTLSFCGFKVFHPHDGKGSLRIAFYQKEDRAMVKQYVKTICVEASEVFSHIREMF
jgi:DNA-directed RNA polymerase subunit L